MEHTNYEIVPPPRKNIIALTVKDILEEQVAYKLT